MFDIEMTSSENVPTNNNFKAIILKTLAALSRDEEKCRKKVIEC